MSVMGVGLDLVLFGMVAAFLVLRLRGILGKREGFERAPVAAPAAERARPVIDANARVITTRGAPDTQSVPGQALIRIAQADPGFSPDKFLGGAERAFGMIVSAFAGGDAKTLAPLLTPEMLASFEAAIAARAAAGETQRTEIRAMQEARITDASLEQGLATVTVRFVSDQVNVTTTAGGAVVAGTDAVTEITDLWTFERVVGSAEPGWRLAAART